MVRRLLPSAPRQAVGPFVFFDHFGPIDVAPGDNHDVRPHPHIGLATRDLPVRRRDDAPRLDRRRAADRARRGQLDDGRARHRPLRAHAEGPASARATAATACSSGSALPEADEESAPSFQHAPAASDPARASSTARRCASSSARRSAPPRRSRPRRRRWRWSSTSTSPAARRSSCRRSPRERALYARRPPVRARRREGRRVHDGRRCPPATTPMLAAPRGGRVVLVGGEPLGHRFMSWNFVSSRARADRRGRGRLGGSALRAGPGETEFIPLPARRP